MYNDNDFLDIIRFLGRNCGWLTSRTLATIVKWLGLLAAVEQQHWRFNDTLGMRG